jgi:hypothetical protein
MFVVVFATATNHYLHHSAQYLNVFSAASEVLALLPAGLASDNYDLHITVETSDSLGARASAATMVQVVPFVPPVGEDLSTAAASIIANLTSGGDVEAVGQLVAALAASLNTEGPSEEEVAAEEKRKYQEEEAIKTLRIEREVEMVRLQAERDAAVLAMDAAEAQLLRLEWEAEDVRIQTEQAAADMAEVERKQLEEEWRDVEELEVAKKTRDVLMNAVIAPPLPSPCLAAVDDSTCQNSGIVTDMEGTCDCDCAGTGFSGSYCQNVVSCTAGANGNACQNGGLVFGTRGCACDCVGTGFTGANCEIRVSCTKGAFFRPCQNSGLPTGTGLDCACSCVGTGFSGMHCTLSAEAVGRESQILGQVTAKPDQLSPESTDKAIGFVSAFDVHTLGEGAVTSLANVMSNLLKASAGQFHAAENVLEAERRREEEAAEAQHLVEEREGEKALLQLRREADTAVMDEAELARIQAEWDLEDTLITAEQAAEDVRRKAKAAHTERAWKEEEAKARAEKLEAVVDSLGSSLASGCVQLLQLCCHCSRAEHHLLHIADFAHCRPASSLERRRRSSRPTASR